MANKEKTVVLLDAHAIIHRAYHALPDFSASSGEPTGALYGLSNMLMKIISDLKPDYIMACYDLPGPTFRHEVYDGYKGKRAKTEDALIAQLENSRKIFNAFNIPIYDCPGFEADDVLGSIVFDIKKNHSKDNIKVIIASGDMDTMQLVDKDRVQIYTLKKGLNDTILYDEDKVFERFGFAPKFLPDYKGLRGDPSDNIIGIKGIGEKTATTLITTFGTIEDIYKKINPVRDREGSKRASISNGIKNDDELAKEMGISPRILQLLKNNEEEALFSKTLAKIRTDAPIDFNLPEKTFWELADLNKIEKVFSEYEFRSLFNRLKTFFTKNGSASVTNQLFEDLPVMHVDPRELKETSIALWLLNSEISNPNLEDILSFARTKSFADAKKYIFNRIEEKGLSKVFSEIEKPIIDIVEDMEKHGILIDQDYFKNLSSDYHKELDKLKIKIYKLAGIEFNINSPKQLGDILFNRLGIKSKRRKTASGALSTKIEVLEELATENEIVREIILYRELQKLLSTYIDVIPQMIGVDGRLHAKFIQNGTTTGRFSSQDPNLQNLPIKSELGKKIRKGFIAQKGFKLYAFDYSQIELRVAAILSKDSKMIDIFKAREDIHAGVASLVFGVPIKQVDSNMRRKAKVINFGIIYGMGVSALQKNLGSSRDEAQKFYDDYFTQFNGVKEYLESIKNFAIKNGFTETLFGRRRYFPNINSRIPFLKNMAERTATNAPLQGTAADIIKLAIAHADKAIKENKLEDKIFLVLQIHDELVYEVKEEALIQAEKLIKNAMENVLEDSFLKFKNDVPLLVEFGFGDSFGDVK